MSCYEFHCLNGVSLGANLTRLVQRQTATATVPECSSTSASCCGYGSNDSELPRSPHCVEGDDEYRGVLHGEFREPGRVCRGGFGLSGRPGGDDVSGAVPTSPRSSTRTGCGWVKLRHQSLWSAPPMSTTRRSSCCAYITGSTTGRRLRAPANRSSHTWWSASRRSASVRRS